MQNSSNVYSLVVKARLLHDQYIFGNSPDTILRVIVDGVDEESLANEFYQQKDQAVFAHSILERTDDEQIILRVLHDYLSPGKHKIQVCWVLPTIKNGEKGSADIFSNEVEINVSE